MREDRVQFHRLIILSCAVHSYFWFTFHRKASWPIQSLFALTLGIYFAQALLGPITDPEVGQKAQTESLDSIYFGLKFQHSLSLLLGAPACQLLQWADTKLCNQQTYFGHVLKSFVPEEGPVEKVPHKKSIVLFHTQVGPYLSWHRLQRHLPHGQGAFRIVSEIQSPQNIFQMFSQQLANTIRKSRHDDPNRRLQNAYRSIASTENVPCVISPDRGRLHSADISFAQDLEAMCTASALGLSVYDIWHGLPNEASSACTLLRMQLKHWTTDDLNRIEFVPPLGASSSFQEFVEWKTKQWTALCKRNLHIEMAYKQFLDLDNTLCGFSKPNEISQRVDTVQNVCFI